MDINCMESVSLTVFKSGDLAGNATFNLFLPEKMTDTSRKGNDGHSHVQRTWQ